MVKLITHDSLVKDKAKWTFKEGFRFETVTRPVRENGAIVAYEFIGTDNFGSAFYERQRYEVDAGRDLEPTLYESLYDITNDSTLPRSITIDRLGPAAVIFDEVTEGGEVHFATVGGSTDTILMRHFGAGVEYTKDLVIYNELWNLPVVERQAGIAYNALLNHIHLYPFISFTYTAANQTAASAEGTGVIEHMIRTIEDAVTNATEDTSNPRRGPFILLCSPSIAFRLARATRPNVPQQGTAVDSNVWDQIQAIVAYNGWSGTRGKKTVSYTGVTSTKAYLIDVSNKFRYLRSFVKQPLEAAMGNPDVSRFIPEQTVWDCYLTNFADIAATTEEITLPTT